MKIAKQSVELIDHMGSDLSVVNAARVSFAKESEWEDFISNLPDGREVADFKLSEKDEKLINYLAKHKHWTPFAHAFASFRIKAPIFVARQLVKHQVGLAWNEVSRRYVDEEPEFFFPNEWRGKPVNAKQGSDGLLHNQVDWTELAHYSAEENLKDYLTAIEANMAPEQARMFLPQNTMTEWIWSGSLAAFSRVRKLRLDSHAQQETQEIAKMIQEKIEPLFPVSWKALMDN